MNLPANARDARDAGLIPWAGKILWGRNGNLLQHSYLRNSINREDEQRVSISSFTNIAKSMSVAQKMHIIWISSEQISTAEQLINNCRTDSCSSLKSSLWLAGLMFHSLKCGFWATYKTLVLS